MIRNHDNIIFTNLKLNLNTFLIPFELENTTHQITGNFVPHKFIFRLY